MAKDFKNNPVLDFLSVKQVKAVQNVRDNLTDKTSVQNSRTNATDSSSVQSNRTNATDSSSVQNIRNTDKNTVQKVRHFQRKTLRNARVEIRIEPMLKQNIIKIAKQNHISTNELIVQVLQAVCKEV